MLRLHRRHLKSCPHRSLTYRRCKCPVWEFGTLNGKRIRRSLDTMSWETAEEIQRSRDPDESPERVTVEAAAKRFVEDCKARNLAPETIGKYELLERELKVQFGTRDLKGISPDELGKYRESWKMSGVSASKKLERLRSFFKFCVDREWRRGNPAAELKAPVTRGRPTLPVTKDEFEKIVWVCQLFPAKAFTTIRIRCGCVRLCISFDTPGFVSGMS